MTDGICKSETKLVVTGGAGFVGSAVIREAIAGACPVVSFVRACERGPYLSGVESRVIDWDDDRGLITGLREVSPTAIIHCAGSSARDGETPNLIYDANVAIVWKLLTAARCACPAARVVLISSASVYGPTPETPTRETSKLDPRSHYALAKVLAEKVAEAFSTFEGLQVVVARPFNVLGAGEPGGSVVGKIVQQVMASRGSGSAFVHLRETGSVRDFIDVTDVARALLHLVKNGEASGVYNVCSGFGTSIAQLVELVSVVAGREIVLTVEDPYAPQSVSIGCGDRLNRLAWAPKVSLSESLRRIMDASNSAEGWIRRSE